MWGSPVTTGKYLASSIYKRVTAQLVGYDSMLFDRENRTDS